MDSLDNGGKGRQHGFALVLCVPFYSFAGLFEKGANGNLQYVGGLYGESAPFAYVFFFFLLGAGET